MSCKEESESLTIISIISLQMDQKIAKGMSFQITNLEPLKENT